MNRSNYFAICHFTEPFDIHLLCIIDRFNTVIGFEFFYTGIEADLCYDDIEKIVMKIHDENAFNHRNCPEHYPALDCFMHKKKYRIEVSQEENLHDGFINYRFRVLELHVKKDQSNLNGDSNVWYKCESTYTLEKFNSCHNCYNSYYPKHVFVYAEKLSQAMNNFGRLDTISDKLNNI